MMTITIITLSICLLLSIVANAFLAWGSTMIVAANKAYETENNFLRAQIGTASTEASQDNGEVVPNGTTEEAQ